MTTIKYTLNKRDLTTEERETVSKFYKGLRALSDTITEETYNERGERTGSTTYYIFSGSWTPYGSCVKHNDRYVFARYSRYDSINEDFTDFSIDCNETGEDHDVFATKHFNVNDNTVNY